MPVLLSLLLPALVGHRLKNLLAIVTYQLQILQIPAQRQCAVIMAQRFGLAVEVKQPDARHMVGLCVIGIARNHLLRRCHPLRILPLVHQHRGNVPHRDLVL